MSDLTRPIGEVLDLIKEDHPDITVSKIRFLESKGLISPERSDAGYRQFDQYDVDKLNWVLDQQKTYGLSLKVIKEQLLANDQVDVGKLSTMSSPSDTHNFVPPTLSFSEAFPKGFSKEIKNKPIPSLPGESSKVKSTEMLESKEDSQENVVIDLNRAANVQNLETKPNIEANAEPDTEISRVETANVIAETKEDSSLPRSAINILADLVGCRADQIKLLMDLGFFKEQNDGTFDEGDRQLAKLLVSFLSHGAEPKNLRILLNGATREADLLSRMQADMDEDLKILLVANAAKIHQIIILKQLS